MTDHDERVSRLYHKGPRDEPGEFSDAFVRREAHKAVSRPVHRPRWMAPVGLAATVLLAAGLLLRVGIDPGVDAPGGVRSELESPPVAVSDDGQRERYRIEQEVRRRMAEESMQRKAMESRLKQRAEESRQRQMSDPRPRMMEAERGLPAPRMAPPSDAAAGASNFIARESADVSGMADAPDVGDYLAMQRETLLVALANAPDEAWKEVIAALRARGRDEDAEWLERQLRERTR